MKVQATSFILLLSLFSARLDAYSVAHLNQAGPIQVPGTKVSLVPPPTFVLSQQFPGFGHEQSGSSIMVTEMPAPYAQITAAFTKEGLATQGMSVLSQRDITISGKPAFLIHVRQSAQGTVFLKWIVATGTDKETVLITATFPERLKAQWSAALEKAVLSAQWDHTAKTDPLAGLNFSIKDDPELKLARRVSNMLLLTKDGTLPGKPTNDPLLIVGASFSEVLIADLRKFAEERLSQTAQVSGATIKKQAPVTIANLEGSEIIAEAEWREPKQPVTIYQVVLRDGKGYFLIQGFAPREEQEKYLAIFKRIAQSFQKK
jgi:hypothetical protein